MLWNLPSKGAISCISLPVRWRPLGAWQRFGRSSTRWNPAPMFCLRAHRYRSTCRRFSRASRLWSSGDPGRFSLCAERRKSSEIEGQLSARPIARPELRRAPAAALCHQLVARAQPGIPYRCRCLHAFGLHTDLHYRYPAALVRLGPADTYVIATGQNTIWRAACSKACLHHTIFPCRPIPSPTRQLSR